MGRYPARFAIVPWDIVRPSDLVEQGPPEYTRDCHRYGIAERHLGLHVLGSAGISLGILAIRCGRSGDTVTPISMAISDECFEVDTHDALQSNPRRRDDGEDAA